MCKTRLKEGFTLIELLVVIAVMAILAAILFPVFSSMKAKARQTTCLSNLHQIAQAGMMYVQDNDEQFPSCYAISYPPYAVDPRTSLQPYVKNWDIFYCPDRFTVRQQCYDPHTGAANSRCMGYGYNWGSGLGWGTSTIKQDGLIRRSAGGVDGVTLAEVVAPAHTFFYGDTNDYFYMTLLRDAMPGVRGKALNINGIGEAYEPPRHSQGNNFAFVDGHVQWLRFPGGAYTDGGAWVVPDMSMYSRTGQWEKNPVP